MHGDQWPRLQFPMPTGTSCSYSIVLFLSFYSLWCCFSFVLTWSRDLRSQGGTWSVCFMLSVWFLNVIFWDTNDAVYVCFYIEHLVQRVGSKERAQQAEYIEGWGERREKDRGGGMTTPQDIQGRAPLAPEDTQGWDREEIDDAIIRSLFRPLLSAVTSL